MGNLGLLVSIILLGVVVIFAAIFAYLRQEVFDASGKAAAKATRGILSRFGIPRGFKVLSNVTLDNGGGKITAENILVGYFGILLVHTLGARGEYYGTLDSESWTLVSKGKKLSIENPVKLLAREEAALRSVFSKNKAYNIPIERIVYISNKSSKTAVYVTHNGELLLGGKLSAYLEKSKFEKDTGLDVKKIANIVTGVHTV